MADQLDDKPQVTLYTKEDVIRITKHLVRTADFLEFSHDGGWEDLNKWIEKEI